MSEPDTRRLKMWACKTCATKFDAENEIALHKCPKASGVNELTATQRNRLAKKLELSEEERTAFKSESQRRMQRISQSQYTAQKRAEEKEREGSEWASFKRRKKPFHAPSTAGSMFHQPAGLFGTNDDRGAVEQHTANPITTSTNGNSAFPDPHPDQGSSRLTHQDLGTEFMSTEQSETTNAGHAILSMPIHGGNIRLDQSEVARMPRQDTIVCPVCEKETTDEINAHLER